MSSPELHPSFASPTRISVIEVLLAPRSLCHILPTPFRLVVAQDLTNYFNMKTHYAKEHAVELLEKIKKEEAESR